MKYPKREKENSLKIILSDFFDAKTVLNLIGELPAKTTGYNNPKISTKDIDLLKSQESTSFPENFPLDFIITKAENSLSRAKFLKLLEKLGNYSINSGEFTSAVYIFEKILAITKLKPKAGLITARTLLSLANIFSRQALWGISFNYIDEAHSLFKKLNNTDGCADCKNLLGTIYGEIGNLQLARLHFEEALNLLKKKKNIRLKGKIEINVGIIYNIEGNYNLALKYYKSALDRFNTGRDLQRVAEIRHNLGMLYSKMRRYETALKEFDKSIKLSSKMNSLYTLGLSYLGKAVILTIREDYRSGDFFAGKALEVCHKVNDRMSEADIYKVKGIINRDTNNFKPAENYLLTSLRINTELKNELNKAETQFELGLLYKRMNKLKESRSCFKSAKEYFMKIGAAQEINDIDKLLN